MRSIIYYDLNVSNFIYTYEHLRMYFSSELYMNKFKSRVENYVYEEFLRFKSRYKIMNPKIEEIVKEVFILSCYKNIEKRGFLVYDLKKGNYYNEGK